MFDTSGVLGAPWASKGYRVICLDLYNTEDLRIPEPGEIIKVRADLLTGVPPELTSPEILDRVAFVGAFPPCTHLAVSGARWFKGKGLRLLADSIHLFATAAEFCERSGAPYFIENPVSVISSHWRKPDHTFHPWYFNALDSKSSYTKKTCLWVGGGFKMPDRQVDDSLEVSTTYIHHLGSAGKTNGTSRDTRSITPRGFAEAVCQANSRS